jgi:DNA-binding NarL/FixJ family response regulator
MTRVLLLEDHTSFRQALAFMLDREPDLTVVGQAGTLAEARDQLADIDVAVVDLDLPDGDGLALLRELRAASLRSAVLVLTASASPRDLARVVEAGAAGTLHKSVGLRDIVEGVRRLAAGESLFSPQEMVDLLRLAGEQREQDRDVQAGFARLSPREHEVLQAVAEGLSDKEVAERLRVRADTVRAHMTSILGKLGVDSRLQAVLLALRHRVVSVS